MNSLRTIEFEFLATERMDLRKIDSDVHYWAFQTYSDQELIRFFGLDSPERLEEEKDRFRKGMTTFNKEFLYFQLLCRDTNHVLGWCGFHTWYTNHHRAELGYTLFDETLRGQGYMREALQPVIEYGFKNMHLHRIEAMVSPVNEPSLKLLTNQGFTREGYLREHYLHHGRYEDSLVFSLLATEFNRK